MIEDSVGGVEIVEVESGEEEHYDNEERIEKSACVHGDVPCRTNQFRDGQEQVRRGRDGEVGRTGASANDGII